MPRPVDIDRAKATLETLVSLRVYSFAEGNVIDGEAEGDEVFIVLMHGAADIAVAVDGKTVGNFTLRMDGDRAVYLPPHSAYQLTATGDCDIAYARSEPVAATPWPSSFAATDGTLAVTDHAVGMEMALATVAAGGDLTIAASDGGTPERFVHIRGAGTASTLSETLKDWYSAIFSDGEHAALTVAGASVDILTISAKAHAGRD